MISVSRLSSEAFFQGLFCLCLRLFTQFPIMVTGTSSHVAGAFDLCWIRATQPTALAMQLPILLVGFVKETHYSPQQ
jgi:hypothetical protein